MKFIVLLRGINVSGKHKIIMKEFVNILLKYPKITTAKSYIQSGNFVIDSDVKNTPEINNLFTSIIKKEYNYEVTAISYTVDEFKAISNNYPFVIEDKKDYITFLNTDANNEKINYLINNFVTNDVFKVDKNIVYVQYATKYSDSKLNNNFLEKKLDVLATTRNMNTVKKLIALAVKMD